MLNNPLKNKYNLTQNNNHFYIIYSLLSIFFIITLYSLTSSLKNLEKVETQLQSALHTTDTSGKIRYNIEAATMSYFIFKETQDTYWLERKNLHQETAKKELQLLKNKANLIIDFNLSREVDYLFSSIDTLYNTNTSHLNFKNIEEQLSHFKPGLLQLDDTENLDILLTRQKNKILTLDERLTMASKLYAITGNTEWKKLYQKNELKLNNTLNVILSLMTNKPTKQTEEANNKLIKIEYNSFHLVNQGKLEEAQALLNSKEYLKLKTTYSQGMTAFSAVINQLSNKLVNNKSQPIRHNIYLSLSGTLLLLVLFFFILKIAKELNTKNININNKNNILTVKNNQLEQFTYMATHDLKVPICNIEGFYNRLQKEEINTRSKAYLEWIKKSVDQAYEVINNLTHYTEIKNTIDSSEIAHNNISELIETITEGLKCEIENNNATVSYNTEQNPNIMYSTLALKSIIQNLVLNGIKYCSPDRPPVINITTTLGKKYHYIKVTDNGIGINLKQNSKNLFKLFKRLDTSKKGSGIGLYMIKQIIEGNGGKIYVESKINEGSTFTVAIKK